MKPLLISSGEPAGIGPDLCLALAGCDIPLVVLGDKGVLEQRAHELKKNIRFIDYQPNVALENKDNTITVLSISCPEPVITGQLNPLNAAYVLNLLTQGAQRCLQGEFSALVTAPIHKANINAAGFTFTGHTEFFADFFASKTVVMMLACAEMRVALVTTHLPLSQVASAISSSLIIENITQLHSSLTKDFGIKSPLIKVAGLNPHAGESGYLGREEIEVIQPALMRLNEQGINAQGPYPADTMFTKNAQEQCDAYVAMYHDQGLPVLKYVGFNQAVNVTLGLPIIRTSVDHGTALDLAGTNRADSGSLHAAVLMALTMAKSRIKNGAN